MPTSILDTLLMPELKAANKTFLGMSSKIKRGLRSVSPNVENELQSFLDQPIFTLSDLGKKYRTINYLEETGLINDTRSQKGKGWRKLGLSEYIYISVLLELRKYGLKSEHLINFKSLYDSYFMLALFAILAGHEITMIFKPNGFCALLDPAFLAIYESEDDNFSDVIPKRGAGEIQLKLSYFTQNALAIIGKPTPMISYSFALSAVSTHDIEEQKDYESKLLSEIRLLKHENDEELLVQRLKDNSLLIKHNERIPNNSDIASKLGALVDGDFCDLTLVKRDGKVANLEIARTEKLSTN